MGFSCDRVFVRWASRSPGDQVIPGCVLACIESILVLDDITAGGAIEFHWFAFLVERPQRAMIPVDRSGKAYLSG